MEILLKRSQINLKGLEDLLSEFFRFRRIAKGRHESLVGVQPPDQDRELVGGKAMVQVSVPLAERERKGRFTEWLSRYSRSLYRVRLTNVGRDMLLDMLAELERSGVDMGFVEHQPGRNGLLSGWGGERFIWPGGADARRATAIRLCEAYRKAEYKPLIDLDIFILPLRSIMRRKLRTIILVTVLSLVCANFIHHVSFSISSKGVAVIVPHQWELPLVASLMALITFLNLMEISLHERKVEIGTIRALGAETTTTIMIFAAEGMILGAIGAMVGYLIVIVANLIVKFGGFAPGLDLVAAAGPGKAILGLFLGLIIGLLGSVPPIIPMIWRPPENCL